MRRILGPQKFCFADVGAARGIPSHLAVLGEVADLMLFEPDQNEADALRSYYKNSESARRVRIYPCALSKNGGMRILHVTNAPTGSSLLRPKSKHAQDIGDEGYFYPLREVQIPTRKLSDVLVESETDRLDFIKLDVQGSELEILEGLGSKFISGLTGLELEIGMPGGYEEQPEFSEIDNFLRDHQLELFDIKPARSHRAKAGNAAYYPVKVFGVHPQSPALNKRVWEVDAVYFRSPTFASQQNDLDEIRRLVAMFCVYGMFQEAYSLTECAAETRVYSPKQLGALQEDVRNWHRETEYCFAYKPWVFPYLQYLQRILRRLACGRRRDRWRHM